MPLTRLKSIHRHMLPSGFLTGTVHRALQYLDSSRHLNSRLTRWALQLQQHSFKTRYRPGAKHGNADGMSRQVWTQPEEDTEESWTTATLSDEDVSFRRRGRCQALLHSTNDIVVRLASCTIYDSYLLLVVTFPFLFCAFMNPCDHTSESVILFAWFLSTFTS